MPLYNDSQGNDDATNCSTTVSDATVTTVAAPARYVRDDVRDSDNDFQRSRALLDGPKHEGIRLNVKRESNVLQHLAKREEQQRLRALEEAALTEKLLANIERSRGETSSVEAQLSRTAPTTANTNFSTVATSSATTPAPFNVTAPSLSETKSTGHSDPIPIFERIKIEEARQLRRETLLGPVAQRMDASYGGSIISLYNALTLETILAEDSSTPPSVRAVAQQQRFILATKTNNDDAQQHAPHLFTAARDASYAKREELAQRLQHVRENESREDAARMAVRQLRDADSKTVLRETLEQDHLRREYVDSSRLLKIAQHHESSLLGAFDVERRTDPLLPHFPENVKVAMQFSKKPPHPVDVYQAAVRERMQVE
ncbi:Hypothetical protein, putative [Bodo saltans]|uniref:Uncharacterized protein n=1 Tax=Bodo saltans TaxID=75058 RepID=A0A0S4JEG4_BODSA|nr:Hypothetical protein, putative [Bodo saltans]|eukprot:CUG89876.1 Hypothetical protein, putative [Bodo saltans]